MWYFTSFPQVVEAVPQLCLGYYFTVHCKHWVLVRRRYWGKYGCLASLYSIFLLTKLLLTEWFWQWVIYSSPYQWTRALLILIFTECFCYFLVAHNLFQLHSCLKTLVWLFLKVRLFVKNSLKKFSVMLMFMRKEFFPHLHHFLLYFNEMICVKNQCMLEKN